MATFEYVGDQGDVEIPAVGVVVTRGDRFEVPEDLIPAFETGNFKRHNIEQAVAPVTEKRD